MLIVCNVAWHRLAAVAKHLEGRLVEARQPAGPDVLFNQAFDAGQPVADGDSRGQGSGRVDDDDPRWGAAG